MSLIPLPMAFCENSVFCLKELIGCKLGSGGLIKIILKPTHTKIRRLNGMLAFPGRKSDRDLKYTDTGLLVNTKAVEISLFVLSRKLHTICKSFLSSRPSI